MMIKVHSDSKEIFKGTFEDFKKNNNDILFQETDLKTNPSYITIYTVLNGEPIAHKNYSITQLDKPLTQY